MSDNKSWDLPQELERIIEQGRNTRDKHSLTRVYLPSVVPAEVTHEEDGAWAEHYENCPAHHALCDLRARKEYVLASVMGGGADVGEHEFVELDRRIREARRETIAEAKRWYADLLSKRKEKTD